MKDYYKRSIDGMSVEVFDIIDAWELGPYTAQAVQYILRSQYKQDELEDIEKAIDFLKRHVMVLRNKMREGSPYLRSYGNVIHD